MQTRDDIFNTLRDALVELYVCTSSVSMLMRRSGAPLKVSLTSQMFWLSADRRAREIPSLDSPEAFEYHQTTSPSESTM